MEEMKNLQVLDIIIALVEAVKATKEPDEKKCQYYLDDGKNRLWGAKYLLGQVLRQYDIKENHYFLSKGAKKCWDEIAVGEIQNYHYTMKVTTKKDCRLELYTGASKQAKAKDLKSGSTFQYRQVFHDEHVIPIADIIDKLINLDNLNHGNVQEILNNIYICRMLKKENAGLTHKRPFSVVETIEKVYIPNKIEILGWEEKKRNL